MLREGCFVVRGPDWGNGGESNNDDGLDLYQAAKAERENETKQPTSDPNVESVSGTNNNDSACELPDTSPDLLAPPSSVPTESGSNRKKKAPHPKLAIGKVISVEPWNGRPGLARRVRWDLTGKEGVYRFGADGGRHDIIHVDINSRATRVTKKHPLPETAEQCAARRGFGSRKAYGVVLRFKQPIRSSCMTTSGILEYPDFGAGIEAQVSFQENGSVIVKEGDLIFGSKDSGWEARFGQSSYVSGSEFMLHKQDRDIDHDIRAPFATFFETFRGSTIFEGCPLRDPGDGKSLTISSTLSLQRGRRYPNDPIGNHVFPPPLSFDHESHASNIAVSKDGRSVTCVATEGRGSAFAQTGFSK